MSSYDTSYSSDIETNIRDPIQVTHNRTEIESIFSMKLLISISIFYPSVVIFDIYYALYDMSCVNQNNNNMDITLYTYLLIDAIYGLGLILFLPIILFIIDLDNPYERRIFWFISLFRTIFIFVWTTIGTYIFWGLDKECEKSIYYYMFVSLIVRYIFGLLFIGLNIELL
jgi:hypothetical protein